MGPESGPEPPFPLQMEGKVIKGFGRGSKEVSSSYMSLLVSTSFVSQSLLYADICYACRKVDINQAAALDTAGTCIH